MKSQIMPYDYQITRSRRRKSVELQIKRGKLEVKAPYFVSKSAIDDFVRSKQGWIAQKLAQSNLHMQAWQAAQKQFSEGETYTLLAEQLILRFELSPKSKVVLDSPYLIVAGKVDKLQNKVFVQKQLTDWYKTQAEDYVSQRIDYWSAITGLVPSSFKVRRYKRRWGSCNARGEVSINWLLMMAPPQIIDYVIVHELCHLAELNHSPRFWQLVEHYYPDHRSAQLWLKQNGHTLTV